eukprot:m.116275 g.116275  ORF g.116275 m.116275 type:complete len:464 (+) comp9180_c0_seq10:293-1684(+)
MAGNDVGISVIRGVRKDLPAHASKDQMEQQALSGLARYFWDRHVCVHALATTAPYVDDLGEGALLEGLDDAQQLACEGADVCLLARLAMSAIITSALAIRSVVVVSECPGYQHTPARGSVLAELGVCVELVQTAGIREHHRADLDDVCRAEVHEAVCRLAVAARPPALLIESLDALRHGVVHNKAHIRLVDAESKRDSGHHHLGTALDPCVLNPGALAGLQPRVIRLRFDSLGLELLGNGLAVLARAAVHNAGLARVLCADELRDRVKRLLVSPLRHNAVAQAGAVRGAAEDLAASNGQDLDDVRHEDRRGGCRQGQHRNRGKLQLEHVEGLVVGPEVVAPLAAAVCLIDDNSAQELARVAGLELAQQRLALRNLLGRDVQHGCLRAARKHCHDVLGRLLGCVAAELDGLEAGRLQMGHLIGHEREQGRHHKRDAALHHGRDLEAHRLAAACRRAVMKGVSGM